MAYVGQVLENSVSGECITFRKTASDTGGGLLASQEERFEVLSGTMKFKMGRKTVIAEAGEVVTVPAGVAHKFANGSDETAHVRVQVRPALEMERRFETAVALAEEGRTTGRSMPKPLDLALFVSEFAYQVRGAFPPVWIQRVTLAPLAWIARKRGHAERYVSGRPACAA